MPGLNRVSRTSGQIRLDERISDTSLGTWEAFCSYLALTGVLSDPATTAPTDRVTDPAWDSFRRARLFMALRTVRPQLTDECLRTIATLGDAFGWVRETATGSPQRSACQLQPVLPTHYSLLYAAATRPPAGLRWRFRGATPPPQEIGDILHQGTLCHFVITPPDSGEPEGYVALYNAQLSDGWAYFGFQRLRAGHPSLMYEGTVHFLDHCFRAFDLRRIYVEVPGYNQTQFNSALSEFFEMDAVLEDREFMAGRHWPMVIAHLDRDRWRPRCGSRRRTA